MELKGSITHPPLRLKQPGQNCLDLSQLSFNDNFKMDLNKSASQYFIMKIYY